MTRPYADARFRKMAAAAVVGLIALVAVVIASPLDDAALAWWLSSRKAGK